MTQKLSFSLVLMFCWGQVFAQEVPSSSISPNYVIQPSDVIRLMVFQEPDLTQEFRVPQNGSYHFPLIGAVNLTGKTVEQAEVLLRELYDRDFLVNPQINLLVIEFSQRRVNVLGAVNSPGTVVFPPEESMTLLDAISRAGGFSRLGNRRSVTLTRKGPDGDSKQYRINVDEIVRGEGASVWTLEKDDLIYVPERLL
jgi:polysaccharide biosynthesis/export protein